jgi:hypothetical protein
MANDFSQLPPISDVDTFAAIKPLRTMKSIGCDDILGFTVTG